MQAYLEPYNDFKNGFKKLFILYNWYVTTDYVQLDGE